MDQERERRLRLFFESEGVPLFGRLDIADCTFTYRELAERKAPFAQSVLLYAVPYYIGEPPERNLSLYALAPDYHLFFKGFHARLIALLEELFPGHRFAGFVDHSPIDERLSCAKAGLGVLGDNGLLLTKEYGSFVFLGEVFCDLTPEEFGACPAKEVQGCLHCGACKEACPCHFSDCASGIGQKKGVLTAEEEELVLKTGLVWGCDLCQTRCPLNRSAKRTSVPFFQSDLLVYLDRQTFLGLTKEQFRRRAFAWRGKATILRNLALFEKAGLLQDRLPPSEEEKHF